MDPTGIKPWLDIFVSYGVPIVITLGVLWLLWKYIPRWIESSIEAQTKVPIELGKLNDTLREGMEKVSTLADDVHQVKTAIKHGASAGERIATEGGKIGTEAITDLRKMKDAVDNDQ